MNFLLVVKHRFKVYERRDWKKKKKKWTSVMVRHPSGIQTMLRSLYGLKKGGGGNVGGGGSEWGQFEFG